MNHLFEDTLRRSFNELQVDGHLTSLFDCRCLMLRSLCVEISKKEMHLLYSEVLRSTKPATDNSEESESDDDDEIPMSMGNVCINWECLLDIYHLLCKKHSITENSLSNMLYESLDTTRRGYIDQKNVARCLHRGNCEYLSKRSQSYFTKVDQLGINKMSITQVNQLLREGCGDK